LIADLGVEVCLSKDPSFIIRIHFPPPRARKIAWQLQS